MNREWVPNGNLKKMAKTSECLPIRTRSTANTLLASHQVHDKYTQRNGSCSLCDVNGAVEAAIFLRYQHVVDRGSMDFDQQIIIGKEGKSNMR